ncbi:MAG: helix-turn-helix transcriptional regulator [Clostridia bacterium]|nr:helix-turn-helix transcriptional regulator [Clostridia bacterium]
MLGERIYFFRKQMGLSQKELAVLLNVTNKAISKWETGAALPKTETIIALAKIFKVSSDELLSLASESKEQKIPEPASLKQLCEQTTDLLQKQIPVNSKPKIHYELSVAASKVYLITTGLVFALFIIGLFFIAINFGNFTGDISDIYIWVVFELFSAFAFSGFYTGLFCYIYFFNTFPTALKVASLFLFTITFVVLFYGGIILFVPTVVKSIKVLINNKKENIDG